MLFEAAVHVCVSVCVCQCVSVNVSVCSCEDLTPNTSKWLWVHLRTNFQAFSIPSLPSTAVFPHFLFLPVCKYLSLPLLFLCTVCLADFTLSCCCQSPSWVLELLSSSLAFLSLCISSFLPSLRTTEASVFSLLEAVLWKREEKREDRAR